LHFSSMVSDPDAKSRHSEYRPGASQYRAKVRKAPDGRGR
jgi:hypothetical protein